MMATQYFSIGEEERAVEILYGLKKNVEARCVDKIERGLRYPSIIYNLTKILGEMDKDEEALPLCDEGIEVCIDTSSLRLLPNITYNKVHSLYKVNDKAAAGILLREVYHAAGLLRQQELKSLAKAFAEKHNIIL